MKYEHITELVIGYIITLDITALASLKLCQIADYFELHRSYLSKKFLQESHVTVLQFIHLEKMKRSETLLRTRFDLSVEAISLLVGISDVRRFRKSFKATFGLNPGTYRSFYKSNVFKTQIPNLESVPTIKEENNFTNRRYYVGNKRVVSFMSHTGRTSRSNNGFLPGSVL
jgi:AraC-like DNA-binding protein